MYKLRKGTRQVVRIAGRTYPTDDELFYRDRRTSDAWMLTGIDNIQPFRHAPIYFDTLRLSILNASSKAAGNRRKRRLDLDAGNIKNWLIGALVVGVLAWYVLPGMIPRA